MSQSKHDMGRRQALKLALSGIAAAPLGSLLLHSRANAADMVPLSEDDPAAKGLGYVQDASKTTDPKHKPNQFCKNCNLVRSDSGELRQCAIFPGKAVHQNGWCTAWVMKS